VGFDKRVVVALSVIALILAPAAVLRALCAGNSCEEPDDGAANVPFCSLADDRRDEIVAGFREGRSPDVLAVPAEEQGGRVPLVLSGTGIASDASIPGGTTLDSIAPTIAEMIALDRPHPEVRSGSAIPDVTDGDTPGVVFLVVVKGLDGTDVAGPGWDRLRALGEKGVITEAARIGSQPNDPTAIASTIGTGGLPYQHGITGALIRNDVGKLVPAWGGGAPVSVIATLADDLDELRDQDPLIGLVATSPQDRGLIAGNWYVDNDRDHIRTGRSPTRAVAAISELMDEGFGDDEVPDLLAVTLAGPPSEVDRALGAIERFGDNARSGAAVVVTGTGPIPSDNDDVVKDVEDSIQGSTNMIEGSVAGGFFVDQAALTETGKSEDEVIEAIKSTGAFQDAFAAITVSFARYC
jgi:hypothetical protein